MRIGPYLIAASLIAGSACSKEAAEETESSATVPVKVATAAAGSIRGLVHATGIITPAPEGELTVIAPEAGRVIAIPRAEGERVAKGDVLVRFEIPSLAADVQHQGAERQRAQAALENARANQTRQKELYDRGIAARKEVEDAERAVAEAQASIREADAARTAAVTAAARATVRATFDGVIAKRFHNAGDVVEPTASDPVLRVIDPRRLEVLASVPISEAARVSMGAPARLALTPDAPEIALKVISRPAQVEEGTAGIPVRLAFVAPSNLAAGTPVQVDIQAEQHDRVVLIPASALVREGEDTAVFVVNGAKAQRRPVRVGLADGANVEILGGISVGDVVIVEGQAGLPDNAAISIDTGRAAVPKDQTK